MREGPGEPMLWQFLGDSKRIVQTCPIVLFCFCLHDGPTGKTRLVTHGLHLIGTGVVLMCDYIGKHRQVLRGYDATTKRNWTNTVIASPRVWRQSLMIEVVCALEAWSSNWWTFGSDLFALLVATYFHMRFSHARACGLSCLFLWASGDVIILN